MTGTVYTRVLRHAVGDAGIAMAGAPLCFVPSAMPVYPWQAHRSASCRRRCRYSDGRRTALLHVQSADGVRADAVGPHVVEAHHVVHHVFEVIVRRLGYHPRVAHHIVGRQPLLWVDL